MPDGSVAFANDGRLWEYSTSTGLFHLFGDLTSNQPLSTDQGDARSELAECKWVWLSDRWPPQYESGMSHGDIAIATGTGQRGLLCNQKWVQYIPKLWPDDQEVVIERKNVYPIQWNGLHEISKPRPTSSAYGSVWYLAVMNNDDQRGQVFRYNFRDSEWEFYRNLCEVVIVPDPPRGLVVVKRLIPDNDQFNPRHTFNHTLKFAWKAPRTRIQPEAYEIYIEFLDTKKGSETRDVIARDSGLGRNGRELRWLSPEKGLLLQEGNYRAYVRANYAQGNSDWAYVDFNITGPVPEREPPIRPMLIRLYRDVLTGTGSSQEISPIIRGAAVSTGIIEGGTLCGFDVRRDISAGDENFSKPTWMQWNWQGPGIVRNVSSAGYSLLPPLEGAENFDKILHWTPFDDIPLRNLRAIPEGGNPDQRSTVWRSLNNDARMRYLGIYLIRVEAKGGHPLVSTDVNEPDTKYSYALYCLTRGSNQNGFWGAGGLVRVTDSSYTNANPWGSSNNPQLRILASSPEEGDYTFGWRLPFGGITTTARVDEIIEIQGYQFISGSPSNQYTEFSLDPDYDTSRHVPTGTPAFTQRSYSITDIPAGIYTVKVYYRITDISIPDDPGDPEYTFPAALCFPSNAETDRFGQPANAAVYPTGCGNTGFVLTWDLPDKNPALITDWSIQQITGASTATLAIPDGAAVTEIDVGTRHYNFSLPVGRKIRFEIRARRRGRIILQTPETTLEFSNTGTFTSIAPPSVVRVDNAIVTAGTAVTATVGLSPLVTSAITYNWRLRRKTPAKTTDDLTGTETDPTEPFAVTLPGTTLTHDTRIAQVWTFYARVTIDCSGTPKTSIERRVDITVEPKEINRLFAPENVRFEGQDSPGIRDRQQFRFSWGQPVQRSAAGQLHMAHQAAWSIQRFRHGIRYHDREKRSAITEKQCHCGTSLHFLRAVDQSWHRPERRSQRNCRGTAAGIARGAAAAQLAGCRIRFEDEPLVRFVGRAYQVFSVVDVAAVQDQAQRTVRPGLAHGYRIPASVPVRRSSAGLPHSERDSRLLEQRCGPGSHVRSGNARLHGARRAAPPRMH